MRIAHYGTFDVDNYGDLLFPHIAAWRLRGHDLDHVSPRGNRTAFADALPSVGQAEVSSDTVDAAIVGGGNIVHARHTSLPVYRPVSRTAYASLWAGAAALASEHGLPLVVNGPSVSRPTLGAVERALLSALVGYANYVAVRDEGSRRNLAGLVPGKHVAVVPDTAFDIDRLWPALSAPSYGGDYVAVHVNSRYMDGPSEAAAALDGLAEATGAKVVLVPIGPCHGDVETATEVAGRVRSGAELAEVGTLRSFASTIAGSTLYVGSSMHGFITALAYGRPALLVLNDEPHEKFRGVLSAAGVSARAISASWEEVPRRLHEAARLTDDARSGIRTALDDHWRRVEEALATPPEGRLPAWALRWRQLAQLSSWESRVTARRWERLLRRSGAREPSGTTGR